MLYAGCLVLSILGGAPGEPRETTIPSAPPAVVHEELEVATAGGKEEKQNTPVTSCEVKEAVETIRRELALKRDASRALGEQVAAIGKERRRLETLRGQAVDNASKLRDVLQSTETVYPVAHLDESYPDQTTVKHQVSMLLAEMDGHDDAILDLEETERAAQRERETIVVEMNRLESRLTKLAAQDVRLATHRLPSDGPGLADKVDASMPLVAKPHPHEVRLTRFLNQETNCQQQQSGKVPVNVQRTIRPLFEQN